MARKFNNTRYPFLKLLGIEFNKKNFYKNIFLINGWTDPEEQKFHRKRQREWYSSHRTEFGNEINIWNGGMKFCNFIYDNIPQEYQKHTLEGYERSGILIDDHIDDLAILYTITLHSMDALAQLDADGIDHGKVEIRMMACHQSKVNSTKIFSMSALCYIDPSKCVSGNDAYQIAISTIDDVDACTKGIEFMHKEFRLASAKILAYEFGRMSNISIEYPMERNVTEVDGVKLPFENYTDFNINYIYGFKEMIKEEVVELGKTNADIISDGTGGYYIMHTPIDYVKYGTKEYGAMNGYDNWGLDKIFNPISENDAKYKELFDRYKRDEPLFIGRILIPVADDGECCMHIHKVYVVRCGNNGTTYFLSDCKEALLPMAY